MSDNNKNLALKFYFDPVCPWAWRTSLWIREVQKVRPINVTWDFLSLKAVNSGTTSLKDTHFQSEAAFRVMALVRRQAASPEEANATIDKLYLAFGKARHDQKEDIGEEAVINAALAEAGVDTGLYAQAMEDPTTLDDVQTSHDSAVAAGGFGVPTLVLRNEDGQEFKGMFGPVISTVPTGEAAGEMWDKIAWLMAQPDFFELKRSR